MALVDSRTLRVLFTVLIFALVLGFLYVARSTLIAFLFAIFFAYLVDPAVSRMEKWLHGRGRAIAAIYLVLIGLVVAFFFFVGPQIGHQAQRLVRALNTSAPNTQSVQYGEIAGKIGDERGWDWLTTDRVKDFLNQHQAQISSLAQRAGLRVAETAQQVWLLFLVPILAAFFLKDGHTFGQVLLVLVPNAPQREFVEGVLSDLNQMLAHFIRAQLTLAAFSLVIYISGLGLMKVPYSLVLGTAGGMMEFIPVVGPLLAAALILGVALLTSYPHWLVLIIFLGTWRLIQDYVVQPRIMGRSLELHPLAAIFGVLAGGEIAGVLGVYLSIPVMASLRIVWKRWRLYVEKKQFGPLNAVSFSTEIIQRP